MIHNHVGLEQQLYLDHFQLLQLIMEAGWGYVCKTEHNTMNITYHLEKKKEVLNYHERSEKKKKKQKPLE